MKVIAQFPLPPQPKPLPIWHYANQVATIDGQGRQFSPAFFIKADQLIRIETDLMETDGQGNPYLSPYSSQGEISTPVVRHSNGQPVAEELYFATTIKNGRVVMSGRLPSGDWKLLPERINRALKFINAPFEVALNPITFIVSTPAS